MYSDYLAELTPAGKTVWEWRTWEHLDPVLDGISEVQAPRTMWAQGNSVEELPDGDILASFRPTSTVVRISRKTGEIVWKLGPPTVAGQHAPTMLGNGNVLTRPGRRSRLQHRVRRWTGGESDRVVVPTKPGNSGGGKDPDFRCAFEDGEGKGRLAMSLEKPDKIINSI
jgi:hypothetical protein